MDSHHSNRHEYTWQLVLDYGIPCYEQFCKNKFNFYFVFVCRLVRNWKCNLQSSDSCKTCAAHFLCERLEVVCQSLIDPFTPHGSEENDANIWRSRELVHYSCMEIKSEKDNAKSICAGPDGKKIEDTYLFSMDLCRATLQMLTLSLVGFWQAITNMQNNATCMHLHMNWGKRTFIGYMNWESISDAYHHVHRELQLM